MKKELQVIFTNEIKLEILDKDFYLTLFKNIVDLKKKKEVIVFIISQKFIYYNKKV